MTTHLILRDAGNGAEVVYATRDERERDQALLELLLCRPDGVRYSPDLIQLGSRAVVNHLIREACEERDEAVAAGWGE